MRRRHWISFFLCGSFFLGSLLVVPEFNYSLQAAQKSSVSVKVCYLKSAASVRLAIKCKSTENDLTAQFLGPKGQPGTPGLGYANTFSKTYNRIDMGERIFQVTNLGAFSVGQRVRAVAITGITPLSAISIVAPIAYVEGVITGISGIKITVSVDSTFGGGIYRNWQFMVSGDVGPRGLQGPVGATGAQGPVGATGAQGPVGATGAQGPIGATGAQGPVGATGAQGPVGATGAQGIQGPAGTNGITTMGDFGSFLSSASQTTLLNEPTPVTYNSTLAASGISIVNNSQITFTKTGEYNIAFSFQLSDSARTSEINIWLRKSGIDVPLSNTVVNLDRDLARYVAAWNFFVTVASPSDYYQIMWYSASATAQLIYLPAQAAPVRPESPSVIVTINQVG